MSSNKANLAAVILLGLAGALPLPSQAETGESALDSALSPLIRQYGLTGDASKGIDTPAIQSVPAQVGMRLFFSRYLSGNLDVACASCHHPLLGGGDQLSLPIGSSTIEPGQLGLARKLWGDAPPKEARNAPTTFNVALWQRYLFHDGRIGALVGGKNKTLNDVYSSNAALNRSVGITTPDVPYPRPDHWAGKNLAQAQARVPLVSPEEMRGEDFASKDTSSTYRSKLAARLGGYGSMGQLLPKTVSEYWVKQFRQAFNAPDAPASSVVTEQNISFLLSEYERSQVFVQNPWSRYVKGDTKAISAQAKQGALLFYRQPDAGGFACVNCHQGDFFTDEKFHHMLLPPIGPGKGQGDSKALSEAGEDAGRYLVTGKSADRYHFRTPSLLNVEVTGPWGHNGAFTELDMMVRHMLDPRRSSQAYNPDGLQQKNLQTRHWQERLASSQPYSIWLPEHDFSPDDVGKLVAFLHTLTDPCVKSPTCLQTWLPADTALDDLHFSISTDKQ